MLINKTSSLLRSFLAVLIALMAAGSGLATESEKKPLKIVFMMGQSNMVGYSNPGTAWYLTQPAYVPPVEVGEKTSKYFNWDHYWTGVRYAYGDSEEYNAKGEALLEERQAIRSLWRQRWYDNFARNAEEDNWNYKEWGEPPHKLERFKGMSTRQFMQLFLHEKAVEAGLYKRMEDYIESPENKFHPRDAITRIAKRDGYIAEDLERVRQIFLKGTKPEDFDALAEALNDFGKVTASNREAYTELVREKVNLPIAEDTYISAFGAVTGEDTEYAPFTKVTQGILSLGYAKWATACGPEYPFGISFERMVDGPVLLVKCSWGGTSLHTDWRPPSLDTKEKPTGERWRWSMEHIQKVLADPGKYHPDYDPEAGVELAGLVWFQGWNDTDNEAYGEQFVHFIKDFRKAVNAPNLPVVSGLMGHGAWKQNTFSTEPNQGMLYAARHPELKGTVDVVNTLPYMPVEIGLTGATEKVFGKESEEGKKAQYIRSRAMSKDGIHYFGSAKFIYLTGDAMARKLTNLLAGGEPTIEAEAAEILGTNE